MTTAIEIMKYIAIVGGVAAFVLGGAVTMYAAEALGRWLGGRHR